MRSFIVSLIVLSSLCCSLHAQQLDPDSSPNRVIYATTEQKPEFPGGLPKLKEFIQQNLHYPSAAQKAMKEGTVFINFIVSEQGALEDVRVRMPVNPELDAEALRLIKTMPTWTPGKIAGKPVACRYTLPIKFAL
ncbi:energy transducer TonB [Spirosoma endophyticum]|uniref:TonB family C-terminal domain-containing protein n=1 Tax=Spirosoma endophyticum TaxID=662367 RepID=A0A1I2FEZ4_9BACT|nr:energy transducer TonB [Spirosoma endophyticum]SFF03479.1 TonB family C-terminal domain-containing protein [Spirosoma endophyticum]